jgi:hypothetical protein
VSGGEVAVDDVCACFCFAAYDDYFRKLIKRREKKHKCVKYFKGTKLRKY